MQATSSSSSPPLRRHSVADSIHSPTLSFSDDDHDDDIQSSDRARFSLDLHDPLNPTIYPHIHPQQSRKQSLARRIITILSFIGLWYTFSLLLSLYNKWMFAPARLNFPFPLFVTAMHMIVQFFLSGLVLWWFPKYRPKREDYMSLKEYAYKIGPCGMATGMDIGLSNASLQFITLAFYTLCKSSTLAFVLIFAFFFHLERPELKLISVITIITIGVILMVATESEFVFTGFVLVITASALSGLRWSLTQLLLQHTPATRNPFSTLFHLAPIMFLSLIISHILFESPSALLHHELFTFSTLPLLLSPGILAFCMTATEFELIRRTSVVTLSVGGMFKEVLTVIAGTIVFGDHLAVSNIWGVIVTLGGIGWYNWIKIQKMRDDADGGKEGYEMMDRRGEGEDGPEDGDVAMNILSRGSGEHGKDLEDGVRG